MGNGIKVPSVNGGIADKVANPLKIKSLNYSGGTQTTYTYNGQSEKTLEFVSTRITVSSSDWSASANASGYYTFSIGIAGKYDLPPKIYLAGSSEGTEPTANELAAYKLLKKSDVTSSNNHYYLNLYATTKPTTTFYIIVQGYRVS